MIVYFYGYLPYHYLFFSLCPSSKELTFAKQVEWQKYQIAQKSDNFQTKRSTGLHIMQLQWNLIRKRERADPPFTDIHPYNYVIFMI